MSDKEFENADVEQTQQDDATPETENGEAHNEQNTNEGNLEQKLEEAQAKAEENWNEVLRARADMENIRRRHERDLEKAHRHAVDKFVNELLPVCDSLELGLQAANAEDANLQKVREGMDMTLRMLLTNIGKIGLEQIDPEGETFNPEYHQAIQTQPAEGVEPNTVVTVVQKGYLFNGRVLRPAMVMVSE